MKRFVLKYGVVLLLNIMDLTKVQKAGHIYSYICQVEKNETI